MILQMLLASAGTCIQAWPIVNAAISGHAALAEVSSWVMFWHLAKGLRGSRRARDDLSYMIHEVLSSQGFTSSPAFRGLLWALWPCLCSLLQCVAPEQYCDHGMLWPMANRDRWLQAAR